MVKSLNHIQQHGTFPPDFDSKEDRNDIGPCPVSEATIFQLKNKVSKWASSHTILARQRLCIFDGFLLYAPSMSALQPHLDIKFFLQVSYAKAKARREARSGYATIEGFWEDPPGYVDNIVWPNYVEDHKWMFEDGDVEGLIKDEIRRIQEDGGYGIEWYDGKKDDGGKSVDVHMETMLEWIVDRLMSRLGQIEAQNN